MPEENSKLEVYAEKPIGIALRATLAAIPIFGSSASVLVESELARRRNQRIDSFIYHFNLLQNRNSGSENAEDTLSEGLLEFAIDAAANSFDERRPALIARLAVLSAEKDPDEVTRRFLIELARNLTNYELAILWSYSGEGSEFNDKNLGDLISTIQLRTGEIESVHHVACGRLERYNLISIDGELIEPTVLGHELVKVI